VSIHIYIHTNIHINTSIHTYQIHQTHPVYTPYTPHTPYLEVEGYPSPLFTQSSPTQLIPSSIPAHVRYPSITTMAAMAPHRPAMLARDSAGKSISLLNSEPTSSYPSSLTSNTSTTQDAYYESNSKSRSQSHSHSHFQTQIQSQIQIQTQTQEMARSHSSASKTSSSPPSLIREASYDSRQDHPITPTSDYIRSPYTQTHSPPAFFTYPPLSTESPDAQAQAQYPLSPLTTAVSQYPPANLQTCASALPSSAGSSTVFQPPQLGANTQKKYECKYRIQHNCDQTFTTSGHASRHSKIHDSLKGIACTHPGCPKKFTRSDNMKQHLETHNKDKKRDKAKALTRAAGVHKMARPSSRTSNGSMDLSQRTKEMYLYHPLDELEERQSSMFQTSPISPAGTALDVLAEAANREMKTEKNFHP